MKMLRVLKMMMTNCIFKPTCDEDLYILHLIMTTLDAN